MPITVHCPGCGRSGTLPDSAAGGAASCPACKTVFTAPAAVPNSPLALPAPSERSRDDDSDDNRESRFRCPYCKTSHPPRVTEEVKTEAWILFVVLLFFCFPIMWIPFVFMREKVRYCTECAMKLG